MNFLSGYKLTIALVIVVVTLAVLFIRSEVSGSTARQELLEADESCTYRIDEMDKQVDALRAEIEKSFATCTQKMADNRKRCDGLVTTYRELVDVKEDEKNVIYELKENKAKAYEAVYRRLGYLPPSNADPE